jgi:hypothetical protein
MSHLVKLGTDGGGMAATPITGETWGDQIDPVRTYLLQEAERPLAELRPKLAEAHQALVGALEGVSEGQAEFTPAVGEGEDAWGIAEVLRHISSVEVIMADRVRQLGQGELLNLQSTYPGFMESVETRRLPELIDTVGRSYDRLLTAVNEIEGHERLDTLDTHRRFGELNCRGWVAMHTLHLQDHARQIGKIKAMEGFPAR